MSLHEALFGREAGSTPTLRAPADPLAAYIQFQDSPVAASSPMQLNPGPLTPKPDASQVLGQVFPSPSPHNVSMEYKQLRQNYDRTLQENAQLKTHLDDLRLQGRRPQSQAVNGAFCSLPSNRFC